MSTSVAVFSGGRPDYAQLRPIMAAIQSRPGLALSTIAGADHTTHGTLQHFVADGFEVHTALHPGPTHDLPTLTQTTAHYLSQLGSTLSELCPDYLLLYGDRTEALAAATAAHLLRIPIAHIEGGDYTAGGCLDDCTRHAISKLASLHFTTNPQAALRLKKMGEEPSRIHTVGLPILSDLRPAPVADLLSYFELSPSQPIALICLHPSPNLDPAPLLTALRAALLRQPSPWQAILLHPNSDPGRDSLLSTLRNALPSTVRDYTSLPPSMFFGLLSAFGSRALRGVFVGNSSAGIKEGPTFNAPTINYGNRQHGRLCCASTIHADACIHPHQLYTLLEHSVSQEHAAYVQRCVSPYSGSDAAERIATVLSTTSPLNLTHKAMTY